MKKGDCLQTLSVRRVMLESLRSGSIASLAMMPFGLLFRALDLRIGHYGRRLIEVLFGELPLPIFRMAVLMEHFLIGWVSAIPLVCLVAVLRSAASAWAASLLYGAAYYAVLNAWLLPIVFNDPLPWTLGWSTVYPSLAVHLVFGLTLAVSVRRFWPAAH